MRNIFTPSLCALLIFSSLSDFFCASASNASVVSESWCRLTEYEITSEMKKGVSGSRKINGKAHMTGNYLDAELRNESNVFAVTEIEVRVTGTYDGRDFERIASKDVFLEPNESARILINVDAALAYSHVKLGTWKITKVMGCDF